MSASLHIYEEEADPAVGGKIVFANSVRDSQVV